MPHAWRVSGTRDGASKFSVSSKSKESSNAHAEMSETATEDMHTETPAVEGAPTEIAEAPMESTEAPAEETEKNTVPVDPNAGYEKGTHAIPLMTVRPHRRQVFMEWGR